MERYTWKTLGVMLLTPSCFAASSAAQNSLVLESAAYPLGTTHISVDISMENADPVSGIQFDIVDAPDVLTGLSASSPLEDQEMQLFSNDFDGSYLVILLSFNMLVIPPYSQRKIASIEYDLKPDFTGTITMDINGVIVLDADSNPIDMTIFSGTITIGQTSTQEGWFRENRTPATFYLEQNRPNPFNGGTTITFELPEDAWVNLTIHNILGQTVETVMDSYMNAASHTVAWEGSAFPSGVYYCRIRAGGWSDTRTMVLLK